MPAAPPAVPPAVPPQSVPGQVPGQEGAPGAVPGTPPPNESYDSAWCGNCHQAEYAAWQESAHAHSAKDPMVAFGMGGTLAELLGEVRFVPAPVTDVDADELIASGKAGALLAGVRGAAPADSAALSDLVQRLAQLAADFQQIAELDLNPIVAKPSG